MTESPAFQCLIILALTAVAGVAPTAIYWTVRLVVRAVYEERIAFLRSVLKRGQPLNQLEEYEDGDEPQDP